MRNQSACVEADSTTGRGITVTAATETTVLGGTAPRRPAEAAQGRSGDVG